MSTNMSINCAQLADGSANILQHAHSITDCLERLNAEIRTHMAGWDGQAQAAYETSYAKWRSVANELNTIYAGMGKKVQTSADTYIAADKAAAQLLT